LPASRSSRVGLAAGLLKKFPNVLRRWAIKTLNERRADALNRLLNVLPGARPRPHFFYNRKNF
jgi:hypothetical protein